MNRQLSVPLVAGSMQVVIKGGSIYRTPDGATWKKINVSLTASTLYSNSTISNGSTYYYAVTAQDINGNECSKCASVKVAVPN